jgi:hypothetical protein
VSAALLASAACSPTFDWRSVALPDTQLVTELPCRPGRFQRDVTVAGVPLRLFMLSCEAGGITYGVATADVGDPGRVDAVLHALRDGAAAAIRSADSPSGALNMPGVTPFSGNSSAHLHGQRPDGKTRRRGDPRLRAGNARLPGKRRRRRAAGRRGQAIRGRPAIRPGKSRGRPHLSLKLVRSVQGSVQNHH